MINPFKFIKANQFFPTYARLVRNYEQKLSGKDARGKPLDFTDQDKLVIKAGITQLFIDLNQSL